MAGDLYVFGRQVDPGAVDRFRTEANTPVRFVAATTGPFSLFAVMETEPAARGEVASQLERYFGSSPANVETAVPLRYGPMVLRYTKRYEEMAFVRIRTEPGMATEVLGATAIVPGYNGSAIVAGSFDVLVEVGADDPDQLAERLLEGMHRVDGIMWTDSAVVLDHFYRGPKEEGDRKS
ncbi:MAG: Lrp/AsnC family transcriptional regulator [Actinobacteria bacterium]|nr:Lrp/AsnC family transcriptional regulator [Actinomycetota bacterium]